MRALFNSNDEMFVAEAVAEAVDIEPILVAVVGNIGEVLVVVEVTVVVVGVVGVVAFVLTVIEETPSLWAPFAVNAPWSYIPCPKSTDHPAK